MGADLLLPVVEGAVGHQHERLHDVQQGHDAQRLLALICEGKRERVCVCVCDVRSVREVPVMM
jgi:hypothetical protein